MLNFALKPLRIEIISGELLPDGTLDKKTLEKIVKAVSKASCYYQEGIPYFYVCTTGYMTFGGQRVCDVVRLKLLELDPYCCGVEVPEFTNGSPFIKVFLNFLSKTFGLGGNMTRV
jgi:hypothetical protein